MAEKETEGIAKQFTLLKGRALPWFFRFVIERLNNIIPYRMFRAEFKKLAV